MTEKNIAKGDAFAVYKSDGEMETFLPILLNNMRVDFLTFFSGIFAAIGSLVVMIYNGVMVGVFQYFFIERGLFWQSFLCIWTHGSLEIPAIILSGGAGLMMGKGLLFPGTYTRFQAFKMSGMVGLKVIMGVVPVTLLAAFIEGFITRHTSIPDAIRFVFILLSFSFVFLYFFYYPRKVAKQHAIEPEIEDDDTFAYKVSPKFDPSEIHSSFKAITLSFRLLFKNFGYLAKLVFFFSLLCTVVITINPLHLFYANQESGFRTVDFFNYLEYPILMALTVTCIVIFSTVILRYLNKNLTESEDNSDKWGQIIRTGLSALCCASIYALIICTEIKYTTICAHILFPFFVLVICISHFQKISFAKSFAYLFNLLRQSFSDFFVTNLLFTVIAMVLYFTSNYLTRVLKIDDAMVWMLTNDESFADKLIFGILVFQSFLTFFAGITLLLISNSILFFSLKEAFTAEHLISKIKNIVIKK
jgi:uncharacterized membrane protein SpoIIM required for sporulation